MQTFGAANQFVTRNLEVESESNRYIDIQPEYVGNITRIKLLETRVLDYDMMAPFIAPDLVDEYALEL